MSKKRCCFQSFLRTPGWSRGEIDHIIRSGARKDARLSQPVPVYWVYVTAWAGADNLVQFRDDIYNRDGFSSSMAGPRRG